MASAEPHTPEQLEKILEITRLLAASNDLHHLLQLVVDRGIELLEAERASIFLYEADADELVSYIAAGARQIRLPADTGIAGATIRSGATLHVPDAYADDRFNPDIDRQTGFRTREILSVPLRDHEGGLVGVLQVLNKRHDRFGPADIALAETLAAQAGVALQRARLIERHIESQRLAAIGQTVAGLAHCIKNILNGVQGGSYILDKALAANDPERRDRGWALVKRNVAFMSDLVLDMLSYARERTPTLAPADPRRLLEDTRDMLNVRTGGSSVEVACEADPAVASVTLDATAIKRCLLNLAGNAVEACDKAGGRVELSCRGAPDGETVFFAISDNGCGIAPENLTKLFHIFFSTKGAKGTGLGLAVSQKIVQEHGGTIDVQSTVGKGTTFVISIPQPPAPPAAASS